MRLRCLALTLTPALLLGVAQVGHAAAPKPQIVDPVGDAVGTKAQDIASVLFRTVGKGRNKSLEVIMTLASDVQNVGAFNYEVDATSNTCGDLEFSMSPGTPYETVTGLNGWITTGCGEQDLVHVDVQGRTITWSLPLDQALLKGNTVLKNFTARVDPAQPALPFPSSATATTLGLVDAAVGSKPWRLV